MGIGIYISTKKNYRRREEHGSAKWDIAKNLDKKYKQYPINQNKILTQDVALGLNGKEHRRNLNVLVYGGSRAGEYVNWRQGGQSWFNIRIGNTSSTIGNIGCLVTSIAILIEKSGANTAITPFNLRTFVKALNKNGVFDSGGNLQYAAVNKVVPTLKYVGNINLKEKSRTEKLALITQYFNGGYFLTIEVKGATPGNQHWVTITNVNGNNIVIVDPANYKTGLWSAYEWNKSSQFNYFKTN